ncbi:MAG: hypothetical protein ACOYT7_03805 [Patescibacteria group bacterium]
MNETREVESKEFYPPQAIAIATTTFYPDWYVGETRDPDHTDKIRGDLFIKLMEEVLQKGYQLSVVDGGSSPELIKLIKGLGVNIIEQDKKGMSASRRQAFIEAGGLNGARVICWTEPEKVSLVKDCLPQAAAPILNGEADVVVPKRDEEAFKTYPAFQVSYEKRANLLWNKLLRSKGLLSGDQELDVFFGPKFLANTPKVLNLFLRKFHYAKSESQLDRKVDPERWANTTFLPVVAALQEGLRVVSVTVPYRHPQIQLENERDSKEFREKREEQLRDIIVSTIHFLRLSEKSPRSKLSEAE